MNTSQLTLHRAQIAVLTHDPHPHYTERYLPEESMYWTHIPEWIALRHPNSKITCLDIGCAYGTLAMYMHYLGDNKVYCTDCTPEYISTDLLNAYDVQFALNNIETESLPWRMRFDVIVLTEVLEHFNFHPLPTLRKIRSYLNSNGNLYLSTPDVLDWGKSQYYSSLQEIPLPNPQHDIVDDHIYIYSQEELHKLLQHAGFNIVKEAHAPGSHGNKHFNLELSLII